MKLGAYKIRAKAHGHNGSFVRHMRAVFFDGKYSSAHRFNDIIVWFNYLKIPTINAVKWVV
jgi:hypothetical protein